MKTKYFCSVVLHISDDETLKEWLRDFADKEDFLKQNIYLIMAD